MSTSKPTVMALFVVALLFATSSLQAQISLPYEAKLEAGDSNSTEQRPFELRRGRLLVEARLYVFKHAEHFVPLLDEFGEPWVERSLVLCGKAAPAGLQSDPEAGLYVMPNGVRLSMELELGLQKPILGTEPYRSMFLRTQVIRLHHETDEILEIHRHSTLQFVQLNSFWTGFSRMPGWKPRVGGDLPHESQALIERIQEQQRALEVESKPAPLAVGE
jgi:hypothetical protein